MPNGYLQDREGNKSSKRLAGFITLFGLFAIITMQAITGIDLSGFAWPVALLAGALFGVSVAERK